MSIELNTDPTCFQEIIFNLQSHWAGMGFAILQSYDLEVGAGTFHPATTLRALGPKHWSAAYVQCCRRPADGRYGENPNRLQQHFQFQVISKPSAPDLQEMYLGSLQAIGIDLDRHDVRFVEDDWESPTLGAAGLGWEVWIDGMEISQFTYFQQVCGHECNPVSGELTYGLERLAMFVLDQDHVMNLPYNRPDSECHVTYGDIYRQPENEYSRWNFSVCNTDIVWKHFRDAESECHNILSGSDLAGEGENVMLVHPAYDQCIKASHLFNLLDARGVVSPTQRQELIGRVRSLARMCGDAYLETPGGGSPTGQVQPRI